MSSTKTKIDQKEYLKRYLSNDKDKKKKKRKKEKQTSGKVNVKIIDDDDLPSHSLQYIEDESDLFAQGEEAPQIVGIIDERPPELKAKEDFSSTKWKKLTVDGEESLSTSKESSIFISKKQGKDEVKARTADSDESPPRRSKQALNLHQSPMRRKHINSDSDASPARRKKERFSPKRQKEYRLSRQTDSDETQRRSRNPQKTSRRDYNTNHSPPRKLSNEKKSYRNPEQSVTSQKYSKSSDLSRHRRNNLSPDRKSSRRDKDSDESPPRRPPTSDGDRINAKLDRKTHARFLDSHLQLIKQEVLDSDESPPRRRHNARSYDSDQSPPRRIKREQESPPVMRIKREPRDDLLEAGPSTRKMTTTLDGKMAGLQNAKAMKVENEKFRQRENEVFEKMSAEASGRFAKTVVREKRGKRREDVEEELRKEFEKRKRDEKKKEIYSRWGKGVKQVEEYKAQLEEAAHEINKPLARYADDKDLDEHLKKQERIGDPMLDYIRSKKKEKAREEGRPEKPLYKGSFPDNRFGIRPGYRWDGVDRSNGFEKKWFEMTSKKQALEEEAYKYSVEDM
ncbi:BUD13 homolog isoform X1 [Topomyia yanbarensis]|uniref:BUD13 homolog isoform X1 n=1 Tax=Topomyia yanbarensis TaxID=2498891 RepID=UPI00273AD1DB|nr:BUD13 homolog isoform X1 [Topomyia yanbarensis]